MFKNTSTINYTEIPISFAYTIYKMVWLHNENTAKLMLEQGYVKVNMLAIVHFLFIHKDDKTCARVSTEKVEIKIEG